jgi:hypothetical protein
MGCEALKTMVATEDARWPPDLLDPAGAQLPDATRPPPDPAPPLLHHSLEHGRGLLEVEKGAATRFIDLDRR